MADRLAGRGSPSPGIPILLGSLFTAICLVSLLCLLFSPQWETNDDVAMSMVAHGYGIGAKGSPNLVFSNVLWGYLVRSIPSIGSMLGYSIATLGVLILVGTVVLHALVRARVGFATAAGVVILLLTRPILFPQFTMNAGLLMVAAIVCWREAARLKSRITFGVGCMLVFGSCLVRSQEFLLVLLVALPVMPWRFLVTHRWSGVSAALLAVAIGLAALMDHHAYQGRDWGAFEALNPARAPYTDFGVVPRLKQQPDILRRHGFTPNDLDLVRVWFFADPKIADPSTLRAMTDELGPTPSGGYTAINALLGLEALRNPRLIASSIVALLLLLLCRSGWRLVGSWLLYVAAVSAMGLIGRPGILRVYEPVVALLTVVPLLYGQINGWRRQLAMASILVAAAFIIYTVGAESKSRQVAAQQIRQELAGFPSAPVVIWGGVFPFEEVYPVLGASRQAMSYRFYGLGVFTLAPFSVPYIEQEAGRGMVELLKEGDGVSIVANEARIGYLKGYCEERMHGHLVSLSDEHFGRVHMSRFRCEAAP